MSKDAIEVREGSAPNFCPPLEEGITLEFVDENGDNAVLEFLGILLLDGVSYGFFFPVEEDAPALSSGEIVILEVVGFDGEGVPNEFELVDDELQATRAYDEFKQATKGLYRFE